MKTLNHSSRRPLLACAILLTFLCSAVALCVQAAEVERLAKKNHVKVLKKTNAKALKQAGKHVETCQQSAGRKSPVNSFAAAGDPQACSSVKGCNDLIVDCIVAGGVFYPDEHDPGTGAPSSGTCVTSSC